MEYKGYIGAVQFDEAAEIFHGEVINLKDVITFQSDSVEGLKREFHNPWMIIWNFAESVTKSQRNHFQGS